VKRVDLLAVLASAASTVACSAILGLQEPTIDNTIEGGTTDSGGDQQTGDTGIDATCGADLQNDAKNCGNCGHDCQGGACTAGVCQPVLVASSTSIAPYAFALSGSDLFFTNVKGSAFATVFKVDKTATNGSPGPTQLVDYGTGYTTPLVTGYPFSVAAQGTNFYTSIYANGGSGGFWEGGVDRCPQTGCTTKTLAYYGVNSYAVATNTTQVFFASSDINDVYTVQVANLVYAGQPGAHAGPAFLDVHLRTVARVQQLPLALGLELGAALGALRQVGFDDIVLRGLEAAREVPRQQPLHDDVRIGFEAKDLTAHASLQERWGRAPDVIIGDFGAPWVIVQACVLRIAARARAGGRAALIASRPVGRRTPSSGACGRGTCAS